MDIKEEYNEEKERKWKGMEQLSIAKKPDTNQTVQSQEMAIGLKFWIKQVEGSYYLCSENKGADQLHGYCAAGLHLCFCTCKKQVFS